MNTPRHRPSPTQAPGAQSQAVRKSLCVFIAAALVAVVIAKKTGSPLQTSPEVGGQPSEQSDSQHASRRETLFGKSSHSIDHAARRNAAEVVSQRLHAYSESRRTIALAILAKSGGTMPPAAHHFFDAVKNNDLTQATSLYLGLVSERHGLTESPDLEKIWPAIFETHGALSLTLTWPAEELLAFGHSVLSTLPPNCVYLPSILTSQIVPAFVAEESQGNVLILPMESLSDPTYFDYISLAYPSQTATLDRTRCLEQFRNSQSPDLEPATLRSQMLQLLVESNPGVQFATDGAISVGSANFSSTLSGPVMFLSTAAKESSPESTPPSTEFWSNLLERRVSPGDRAEDDSVNRQYADLARLQARRSLEENQISTVETLYNVALRLSPSSYDALEELATFLSSIGRAQDAVPLLEEHIREFPEHTEIVEAISRRLAGPTETAAPAEGAL